MQSDQANTAHQTFRLLAFCIEVLPLILLYLYGNYIAGDESVLLAIFPLASLIYLSFGWYLFKAEQFRTADIVLTLVAGIYCFLCTLSILFFIESWSFNRYLAMISLSLGLLFDVYLIFLYMKRKNNPLEHRFSLKLLSRLLVFQLIILNMLFSII